MTQELHGFIWFHNVNWMHNPFYECNNDPRKLRESKFFLPIYLRERKTWENTQRKRKAKAHEKEMGEQNQSEESFCHSSYGYFMIFRTIDRFIGVFIDLFTRQTRGLSERDLGFEMTACCSLP